jgi:hypothetical protein
LESLRVSAHTATPRAMVLAPTVAVAGEEERVITPNGVMTKAAWLEQEKRREKRLKKKQARKE